jgi:hypothetical protein
MNDDDGFRIEAAMQFGFDEVEGATVTTYRATESQLLAFAKACERAGMVKVSRMAAAAGQKLRFHGLHGGPVLDALIVAITKETDAISSETLPFLAAERVRSLIAAGYVRGADGVWVKS